MPESTIWKYDLSLEACDYTLPCSIDLQMPKQAAIRAMAVQQGKPMLWVQVDPNAPLVTRKFLLVGTGQGAPNGGYCGMVQLGPLVIHIFDMGELVIRLGD